MSDPTAKDDEATMAVPSPAAGPTVADRPALVGRSSLADSPPGHSELTPTWVDGPPRTVTDDEATRINPPKKPAEDDEATRLNPKAPPAPAPQPKARASRAALAPVPRKPLPWQVYAVGALMLGLLLIGLWRNQRADEAKKPKPAKELNRDSVDKFLEGR